MANTNAAGALQVSDQGGSGAVLGKAASDKIAFLGGTPIVQQAGLSYTSGNTSALIASLISLAVSNSNVLKSFGLTS